MRFIQPYIEDIMELKEEFESNDYDSEEDYEGEALKASLE